VFVDRVTIEAEAGKGGDGAIHFLREAFRPRGGPDGGNGGDGGSVILRVGSGRMTLRDVGSRRHYKAQPGQPGRGRNQFGRKGKSVIITVPAGTLVTDDASGDLIADLTDEGTDFVLCQGGKGGKGNAEFATALNQVPRVAEQGTPGQQGIYRLELKLIAEVGLVGLPNAGKSTFLKCVTRANPKVAAYPFTTLSPHLGVAHVDAGRELILADIPGLIEGASDGKGLGDEFLRHVERTKVLLHLVDGTGAPELGSLPPLEAYRTIRGELEAYAGADLGSKPEVVALNKIDAMPPEDAKALAAELSQSIGCPVYPISAIASMGTIEVLRVVRDTLDRLEAEAAAEDDGLAP
jgi:GTP-binding protein